MPAASTILHFRISPEKKRLLLEAAKAAHASTLTEYVVTAALRQAERDLLDRQTFVMKSKDWDAFNQVLDRPARVIPALRKLAKTANAFRQPA